MRAVTVPERRKIPRVPGAYVRIVDRRRLDPINGQCRRWNAGSVKECRSRIMRDPMAEYGSAQNNPEQIDQDSHIVRIWLW